MTPADLDLPFDGVKSDPGKMGGTPCVGDTRIPVYLMIGEGLDVHNKKIKAAYPQLTDDMIDKAIEWALLRCGYEPC